MGKRRINFVIVLFFLAISTSVSGAQGIGFGLSEAIQYAVGHSPQLKQYQLRRESRGLERSNALAKFFPSLDVSATHGIEGSDPKTKDYPWASSLSLGVTETLYDNGAQLTGHSIARSQELLSEIEYREARAALALEVAKEFYNLSLQKKLIRVRQRQFDILQKQFETISRQYRQGMKTKTDYLRFKADVQRARIQLVESRNAIDSAKENLFRILGAPLGSPHTLRFAALEAKGTVPVPKLPPKLNDHYVAQKMRVERKINDLNVRLTERKYWPELFLTGGVTYSNSEYLGSGNSFSDTDSLSWNVLLKLQYNLWDWGTRRRDTAIARKDRDIKNAALTQSLQKTKNDLATLRLRLQRWNQELQLSRELLTMEEDTFNFLEREYRRGQVPYLDLIRGLERLSGAQRTFFTSYFRLKEAIAEHHYHVGDLYESFVGRSS